jgi:hypothetical protein
MEESALGLQSWSSWHVWNKDARHQELIYLVECCLPQDRDPRKVQGSVGRRLRRKRASTSEEIC